MEEADPHLLVLQEVHQVPVRHQARLHSQPLLLQSLPAASLVLPRSLSSLMQQQLQRSQPQSHFMSWTINGILVIPVAEFGRMAAKPI